MRKIDHVIFDFGRVLIQWDLRYLFEKLIDDARELDWFLANVVTPEWHFQADAGRDVDDMVVEKSAEYPEHTHLIEAYRARFSETIPGTIAGVPEILADLAERKTPMFGITNFGSLFWDQYAPTQPAFDYFSDIVVSGKERIAKPDPAIYRLAMQRFGTDASRCLFIDDNAANVAAAREFGLAAHQFSDADTLRRELVTHGLLDS